MSKMSLAVERAAQSTVITGPADVRDQKWLDEQVALLSNGIEAAQSIWANWFEGRRVGRLHPGQSAGEYIASRGYRLTLAEAMAALPDGSTRQVAAVAGVDHSTVVRARGGASAPPDDAPPPARVVGGDGKSYPAQQVPRGRPVPTTRYPSWWREVGAWLSRARKEDARVLLELNDRVRAAMLAAGVAEEK